MFSIQTEYKTSSFPQISHAIHPGYLIESTNKRGYILSHVRILLVTTFCSYCFISGDTVVLKPRHVLRTVNWAKMGESWTFSSAILYGMKAIEIVVYIEQLAFENNPIKAKQNFAAFNVYKGNYATGCMHCTSVCHIDVGHVLNAHKACTAWHIQKQQVWSHKINRQGCFFLLSFQNGRS